MRWRPTGTLRRTVLAVLGLLWLFPSYLIVVNAVRPADAYEPAEAMKPSGTFAFFENVSEVWKRTDLEQGLISTFVYSALSPLCALLLGALAGYAIVVLRLRRGFAWFMLIYGGTMFPFQMLVVPLFVYYSKFELYDTKTGMLLIYTAISIPFAALVMRNFFGGIARSIFEAARMDGASTLRIFFRIYLPLSWPALAAVFILEFTLIWNDLLFGLVLTQSESSRPVTAELAALTTDIYAGTPTPIALAAGLVASLPTIAVFLLTQRLFTRGMSLAQH